MVAKTLNIVWILEFTLLGNYDSIETEKWRYQWLKEKIVKSV